MPSRTARRRWPTWLGWGLVLGGVGLIGYVAWQFLGTNIVSEHRQREITSSLRRQWERGRDSTTVEALSARAVVRIPRFGADYEVPVVEGVGDRELAAGFGHYPHAAAVGAVGNYALAAHRVTHGQPLRRMPDLEPGDTVVVETRTTVYTYVLDTGGDALTVPFTAGWVLEPLPVNPDGGVEPRQQPGGRLLTLTTCSELFHTDNRLVAFGHLQSERPRGQSGGQSAGQSAG